MPAAGSKSNTGLETRSTKFQWPPGRVEVKPSARSSRAGGEGGGSRAARMPPPSAGAIARWWRAIERTWLGLVTEPMEVHAQRAGWQPDAPSTYCPRCGTPAGPFEADDSGCGTCRAKRLPWDRLVRPGTYEEPLDQWVRDLKFARMRTVGATLGGLLAAQVMGVAGARGAEGATRFVIVPVPTSTWRRLVRGIDHPLVIARAMGWELGAPVWPVLKRRHRAAQTSLPKTARSRNVRGSMRMGRRVGDMARGLGLKGPVDPQEWTPEQLAAAVFVVVDDVTTTGETLMEACRALRRGLKQRGLPQVRVWAAVAAKTTVDRGRTVGSSASAKKP